MSHAGYGVSIYHEGDRYEGYWQDGTYHGHGKYTFANGVIEEGVWEFGDLVHPKADES